MVDQRFRNGMGLDEQQTTLLDKTLNEYEVEFPTANSFDDLESHPGDFLFGLQKRILQADKASQDFFEEGLIPEQADRLLCAYIYRVGIDAFEHPAVIQRLALTEKQLESIQGATLVWRETRLRAWSNLAKVKQDFDKQGRSLALYLDLRSITSIQIAFPALTKKQAVQLRKILDTLKSSKITLAMGFPNFKR